MLQSDSGCTHDNQTYTTKSYDTNFHGDNQVDKSAVFRSAFPKEKE